MSAGGIFISHASKDAKAANTICSALEARGLACWIAPRDIKFDFQSEIVLAIRNTKVMIIVFSSNASESDAIRRELALASKYKAVIIPVRLEDVLPDAGFEYELVNKQWVDLFADWEASINKLADLARAVGAKSLELATPAAATETSPPQLPHQMEELRIPDTAARLPVEPPPEISPPTPAPPHAAAAVPPRDYEHAPSQPAAGKPAAMAAPPQPLALDPKVVKSLQAATHVLFSWKGRVNRAKAWIFVAGASGLYLLATILAVSAADSSSSGEPRPEAIAGAIALIILPTFLLIAYCQFAIAAKRMHDRNLSARRLLYIYGPQVLAVPLIGVPGVGVLFALAALGLSIWGFVEVYCLPGTVGDNPYGPDPINRNR